MIVNLICFLVGVGMGGFVMDMIHFVRAPKYGRVPGRIHGPKKLSSPKYTPPKSPSGIRPSPSTIVHTNTYTVVMGDQHVRR